MGAIDRRKRVAQTGGEATPNADTAQASCRFNFFDHTRAKTAPVQRVSTEVSLNIAEQIEL
jgi:hypothetical protein